MRTTPRQRHIQRIIVGMILALTAVGLAAAPVTIGAEQATVLFAPSLTAEEAIAQIASEDGLLRFDVAEDGTRFVWSGNPDLVDGLPTISTPYVTQGYIYPAGTLTESNGVLTDGSPEFPDKVLGQWSCYGWRLGGNDHAATPAWLTTHLFNFGSEWGEATIVSEGYSIDDLDVALARAIAGGTGPYDGARGIQRETNLGYNPSQGMNFRYELTLAET